MKKKFSPVQEIDDKVQSLGGLESKVKLNNERMVQPFENHPLHLRIGHLILTQNHIFLKSFHCENALVVSLLHLVDLAERASTNDFEYFEVFD